MYEKEIIEALNSGTVIESLRNLAIKLKNENLSKEEVYSVFHSYYLKLIEEDKCESEYLWDILDMISGWYVGRNINFDK